MNWEVRSTIYGGKQYTTAEQEDYDAAARLLVHAASSLSSLSNSWTSAPIQCQVAQQRNALCPAHMNQALGGVAQHRILPMRIIEQQCEQHAKDCTFISQELSELADLLIRAHSLYSQAESTTQRIITESIQLIAAAFPKQTTAAAMGLLAGGALASSMQSGKFNATGALTASAGVQEGLLSALAAGVSGINPAAGLFSTDEVNHAAGRIATASSRINNHMQGDFLELKQVQPSNDVVRESHSVSDAIEELRRLAEGASYGSGPSNGLQYGTIAIQQYRLDDGTRSWLVSIPGTDGQSDSPFGWPQNVELMSSNRDQRIQADSARMVAQAMRKAGINADEPVALIGHSQGGIVAATIASDMQNEFNVQHIVTAGSPIANHPIAQQTWVTSIEMDDELVASLDGARNPSHEQWLTIRGRAHPSEISGSSIQQDGSCTPGNSNANRRYAAAEVKDAPEDKEITHWLRYHQAAYRNAQDLGSAAVATHEQHFQSILDGKLEHTTYWQGRMRDAATLAPQQRGEAILR